MNLNKTRTVKVPTFTATLQGDGTTVPMLIVTSQFSTGSAEAYISSSELRELGAKFVKWADGMDKEAAKS